MKKHKHLRTIETPTDIIVLGTGFTYQLGNGIESEVEALINEVEPHEMGITDDYSSVDIEDTCLQTTGSVIVLTLEEFEKLKHLNEDTIEGMIYKDFVGDVILGVVNDDTGEFLPLYDPERDYYILYEVDLTDEEENSIDKAALIKVNGTYSSKELIEIEGD
jgi:hypothetical protein